METIFWITVALAVIAVISVLITVIKYRKVKDPVRFNDGSGNYEDVEYSERPFIEYFN